MADAGFRVDGVLYPFPDSFTIGDSVLVKIVSGLDMEEFGELLAEAEEARQAGRKTSTDPRSLAGMMAVSIWHKHPRWDVEKAARYFQQIDMAGLAFEGGDEEPAGEEPDVEGDPPSPSPTEPESRGRTNDSETPTETPSVSPAAESSNGPNSGSAVTPLSPSGSPGWPITSQGSSPG